MRKCVLDSDSRDNRETQERREKRDRERERERERVWRKEQQVKAAPGDTAGRRLE
jgi:hypothetical protein